MSLHTYTYYTGQMNVPSFCFLPRCDRSVAGLSSVQLHDLRERRHPGRHVVAADRLSVGDSETAATARYAHLSDDPQSDAAALISERIAAAMASGSTGDGGAEVVPISSSSPRHERQVRYSTCLSTRVICVTRVSGLRSQFRSVG